MIEEPLPLGYTIFVYPEFRNDVKRIYNKRGSLVRCALRDEDVDYYMRTESHSYEVKTNRQLNIGYAYVAGELRWHPRIKITTQNRYQHLLYNLYKFVNAF
jgi:hypothetical protein